MGMSPRLKHVAAGVVLVVSLAARPAAGADKEWAVTVYHGILSHGLMNELVRFQGGLDTDYRLWIVGVSKRLTSWKTYLDIEGEGQVAKHTQGQDHWEFNGLFSLRWLPFPWDAYLDTTTAFGIGLSYASEKPPFEKNHEGNSQLLAYLQAEAEFGLPAVPRWKAVCRIHHRSGMFGTFGNMTEASNALCFGLRYKF